MRVLYKPQDIGGLRKQALLILSHSVTVVVTGMGQHSNAQTPEPSQAKFQVKTKKSILALVTGGPQQIQRATSVQSIIRRSIGAVYFSFFIFFLEYLPPKSLCFSFSFVCIVEQCRISPLPIFLAASKGLLPVPPNDGLTPIQDHFLKDGLHSTMNSTSFCDIILY